MGDTPANALTGSIDILREFGLSHTDFRRIFPRIEPTAKQAGELKFIVERDDGRVLEIEMSAEKVRRLATLKIPFIDIRFRFHAWSEEQRLEFFEKFERAFQKGGG